MIQPWQQILSIWNAKHRQNPLLFAQRVNSSGSRTCDLPSDCKFLFYNVTPGGDNGVADGFHAAVQAGAALGGFVSGADLVVVEEIFRPHLYRGEIRHNDVSTARIPCSRPNGWIVPGAVVAGSRTFGS